MPHVGARGQRFRQPTDAVQENDTDGGQRQSRWLRCVPLTALLLNRPTLRSKQVVLTVAGEPQPCRRKSDIEVVPIGGRPEQTRGLNLESQRWHCRGLSFSLLSFFALERSLADPNPAAASLSESSTKQKRHFVLSVTGYRRWPSLTFDLPVSPLPGEVCITCPDASPSGLFCVNGRPESRAYFETNAILAGKPIAFYAKVQFHYCDINAIASLSRWSRQFLKQLADKFSK